MATVFSPPEGLEEPTDHADFMEDGFDRDGYFRAEEEYVERIVAWCRENSPGDRLAGTRYSYPVADGKALYVVYKSRPLSLIHVPIGDSYQVSDAHMRGLKIKDIDAYAHRDEALAAMFKNDDDWWDSQKPGTVLHYHNSQGDYVRGEIIVKDDKVQLKSIALVGEWRNDRARRWPDGRITTGFHAQKVLDGDTFQPNARSVYEHPKFSSPRGDKATFDPRTAEPIDLELPTMTRREQEVAGLLQRAHDAREELEGVFALTSPAKIRKKYATVKSILDGERVS